MKILIFPRGDNPYQELLYSEMRVLYPNSSFTYVSARYVLAPFYPLIFLFRRLQGYDIIHIHWLPFVIYFPIPSAKQLAYYYGVFCLMVLTLLRYKIVWTVHDVLPHEQHTSDDLKITQKFVDRASAVIMLSSANIADMARLDVKYNPKKAMIIPHGNYVKTYPNHLDRRAARKKLAIPADSFVFVFFGMIKPYKNIPGLLEAFATVLKTAPDTYLVIAGKVYDDNLREPLVQAKAIHGDRLILSLENIPDDSVQVYYNASDVAVYPFDEITNSGSAILAATFGTPIIAPLIGAIADIPSKAGIFYNPNKADALTNSMLAAMSNHSRLNEMAKAAAAYAETLSWDKIADKTMEAYKLASK